MKNIVVGLILLLFFLNSLIAQEPIKWGAVAGININDMSSSSGDKKQIGFHIGAKAELPFTRNFFLEGSLLFIQKGHKTGNSGYILNNVQHTTKSSIKSYYLQLPIYAGYKVHLNDNLSIFGAAGGHLALGLFGKYKATNDGQSGSQDLYESGRGDKRFDCGIGLRGGVEIYKKVQVSGGYEWGLINTKKYSSYSIKHRNAIISCAYLF